MEEQRSTEPSEWYQRLRRFFFSKIRYRIILPYLILTIIVAALGIYVVTKLVVGSLDERLTNRLLEAGRAVSDGMVRKELKHLESVRTVAYTVGMAEALQDGDADRVVALAQPAAVVQGVESLIVVDSEGQEVLSIMQQRDGSYQSMEGQFETAQLWMVRMLLEVGNPDELPKRGLVFHPAVQSYYYFTAIPIGLEDQVVGVVMVGTSIETLLVNLSSTSLADVILYLDGGRAVATTFAFAELPAEAEILLNDLTTTPSLYESALQSTAVRIAWPVGLFAWVTML